jgi:hypothetical protein
MPPRPSTPTTPAPPPFGPPDVRALRFELGLSQAAFSRALNVSLELVQSWEAGRRTPQGAALRLLELLRADPGLLSAAAREPAPGGGTPLRPLTPAGTGRGADASVGAGAGATTPRQPSTGRPSRSLTPASVPTIRFPFEALVRGLAREQIRFVLIGSAADHCHGAPDLPDDLDILYDREPANLTRLANFLRSLGATLRGAPGAPPFAGDARTLAHTSAIAFDTSAGPIDARQRVSGIGDYAAAQSHCEERDLGGRPIKVLTLPALIIVRRAAGRPRDREQLELLQRLRDAAERKR